jgi:hypothetical protein
MDDDYTGLDEVVQPRMMRLFARSLQYAENTVRDLVLYNPVQASQVPQMEL